LRIEDDSQVLVICTDVEHINGIDESIVELARNADLLIHDGQYTDEEYVKYRGWGHSTWRTAVEVAKRAGVKKLIITHHDPDHDDDMLDAMERECPAGTRLLNAYYVRDAACMSIVEGKTRIIWSKQGSRMGCVLGSFGFDLTVKPLYESMKRQFPQATFKALTDDLIGAFLPEPGEGCPFHIIKTYYQALEEQAAELGLRTNMSKRVILLARRG